MPAAPELVLSDFRGPMGATKSRFDVIIARAAAAGGNCRYRRVNSLKADSKDIKWHCVSLCMQNSNKARAQPLALDKRSAVLTLHASLFSTGRIRVFNSLFSTRASKSAATCVGGGATPLQPVPRVFPCYRRSHMFSTTANGRPMKTKRINLKRRDGPPVSAAFRKAARYRPLLPSLVSQFSQNTLDQKEKATWNNARIQFL